MKSTHFAIALVAGLVFSLNCFGQITITFPSTRAVFQRDNEGMATVYIGGYTDQCMERIEARFVPRAPGQGTAAPQNKDWEIIQTSPQMGLFYGSMVVQGGWYRLQVRGFSNGVYTSVSEVERVGVGEVFVVAGQSNATGGDSNPNGPGAADDRVNSVNFQNINPINPYSSIKLPNPVYVKLEADVKTAPFGNYAWCWGAFGDSLVKEINVPVMVFNAGWSGSGIRNWSETTNTSASTTSGYGYTFATGLPFGHLQLALQNYVAQLGVRAILWHQGESENNDDFTDEVARISYRNYLSNVINASRTVSGKAKLAWIVSRASWFRLGAVLRGYQPVIDAQNDIIGLNGSTHQLPDVFAGPETDLYTTTTYRSDGIHFRGDGLLFLAGLWKKRLTSNFFANSTPYAAKPPVQVAASVAASSSYLLSASAGFSSYQWMSESDWNTVHKNSASNQWTGSTGTYRLQSTDAQGNVVLSPILKVPSFTIPMGNSVEFAKSAAGGASFADISEQVTVADPDEIGSVFFPSFPAHTSRLEINGKTYGAGAASWPTEGITVPYAGLSVKIDPDDSGTQITLPFVAVNDYCIHGSEATLKVNWEPSNPLPVTIVAFDAAVSEQSVGLKWTTVQELTSSYFLIERSHDGKAWKGLDEVPAYGNSDELVAYDYVDETPIPGVNYYRLKMVDQDGTSAYSNRISVRFGDSEPLMVLYPNPVSEKLFIESKTWVAMESILIRDLHGRTVWDRSLETTPINQRKNAFANVGSWSEGIYLVEVRYQDGSRKLGRFLIRR